MTTFAIQSNVTMSTEKSRVNYASFYKSFSANTVKLKSPLLINSLESIILDLSESAFIIIVPDDYGIEEEILSLEFTDTLDNKLSFTNISYYMSNVFNMKSVKLINTGSKELNINIVY